MDVYIILAWLAAILFGVAGWVTNIWWTFHQSAVADVLLGILGAFVPIIGAVHGIYLWF